MLAEEAVHVSRTILSQGRVPGSFPFQLHTLFTILQRGYVTGQYIQSLVDIFLTLRLWGCGTDKLKIAERGWRLRISGSASRERILSNCPHLNSRDGLERHIVVYDLGRNESRIAKSVRRSFLGRRSDGE